jgi:hypothetical protein
MSTGEFEVTMSRNPKTGNSRNTHLIHTNFHPSCIVPNMMCHRTSLILLLSVILASASAKKRGSEAPATFGLPRKWSSFTGMAGLDHEAHYEPEISNEKINEVKLTGKTTTKKVVQEEPGTSPLLPHPADSLNSNNAIYCELL